MIRINQLKIKIDVHRKTVDLKPVIAQKLHIRENRISEYTILRRSVDARKKPDIYYNYTVAFSCEGEEKIVKQFRKDTNLSKFEKEVSMADVIPDFYLEDSREKIAREA